MMKCSLKGESARSDGPSNDDANRVRKRRGKAPNLNLQTYVPLQRIMAPGIHHCLSWLLCSFEGRHSLQYLIGITLALYVLTRERAFVCTQSLAVWHTQRRPSWASAFASEIQPVLQNTLAEGMCLQHRRNCDAGYLCLGLQ